MHFHAPLTQMSRLRKAVPSETQAGLLGVAQALPARKRTRTATVTLTLLVSGFFIASVLRREQSPQGVIGPVLNPFGFVRSFADTPARSPSGYHLDSLCSPYLIFDAWKPRKRGWNVGTIAAASTN